MSSVYVLGNASLDISLRVPRLPMPGETLMASGIVRAPGGKGLNQAVVVARADVPTHFCAAIGNEPEAEMIWSALAAEHLSGLQLFDGGRPTDVSTLLVDPAGENCIISTGDCADALSVGVAEDFCAGMRRDDILLVQGNLTEPATFAAALARRLPLGRAVEVAQYAAALTVERQGCFAALPAREELAAILG